MILINLLKSKGYNEEGNIAKDGVSYILYLYKKEVKRKSWVDFYSSILATDTGLLAYHLILQVIRGVRLNI